MLISECPVVGKISSSLLGLQAGANVARNLVVAASYVETPWHSDTLVLPKGDTCGAGAQLSIKAGTTFPYFLPLSAGQCRANSDGTTTVFYGGWASPYTDNYATNPVFTTAISQGMTDRRAAGTSWRLTATYASPDSRALVIVGDSVFNYGNAAISQTTNEFNLDGTFRFSHAFANRFYHGLQLRYRFAHRTYTNTGSVGGQPYFNYNRTMLEYAF